jgi:hypothetical protein
MDREYYFRKQAKEQQAVLAKELATQQLLREAAPQPAHPRRQFRVVLGTVLAGILMIPFRLFRPAA